MIFAAVVEQMSQNQVSPSGPFGDFEGRDLESPQLVELAADAVERLLARRSGSAASNTPIAVAQRAAVLGEMHRWRDFSGGSVNSFELGDSARAVRAATQGPARTSGDHDTLERACVRIAADTAAAASQVDSAENATVRERLLWKARLASERLRMATELLLRPAFSGR